MSSYCTPIQRARSDGADSCLAMKHLFITKYRHKHSSRVLLASILLYRLNAYMHHYLPIVTRGHTYIARQAQINHNYKRKKSLRVYSDIQRYSFRHSMVSKHINPSHTLILFETIPALSIPISFYTPIDRKKA